MTDKPRFWKHIPPFCWGRRYYKYGIIITILGYINSFGLAWMVVYFGIEYFTLIWPIFLVTGFAYKANLMHAIRPCADCPINKDAKYEKQRQYNK